MPACPLTSKAAQPATRATTIHFREYYSRSSRRYKRPIVTNSAQFKNGSAVEWNSSSGRSVRPETTVINSERFSVWQLLLSAVWDVSKRSYVLLRDRRKLKWILAILVTFISFQSYFVRELLSALFLFTIVYVILATLAVAYILIVDVLDRGSIWVESIGRSFLSSARHHFASPARVPNLPKGRALDSGQKLGHV